MNFFDILKKTIRERETAQRDTMPDVVNKVRLPLSMIVVRLKKQWERPGEGHTLTNLVIDPRSIQIQHWVKDNGVRNGIILVSRTT